MKVQLNTNLMLSRGQINKKIYYDMRVKVFVFTLIAFNHVVSRIHEKKQQ